MENYKEIYNRKTIGGVMLIERILNQPNRKRKDLELLKSSTIPNIIYGAGSYASDLYKFLLDNGIKLELTCVNKEYIIADQKFFDLEVRSIDEIDALYHNYNLIIAYSDYKSAKVKAEKNTNVNKIIFIDSPNCIEFFDYKFVLDNLNILEDLYNKLGDELSKDTLVAFINAKLTGNPDDLSNLIQLPHYFNDILQYTKDDVFVDCGAYTGDTILGFSNKTGNGYRKIYALEPDEDNYKVLLETVKQYDIHSVETIKKGCWSKKATLNFTSNGILSNINESVSNLSIEVDKLDNLVKEEKVTLIKMDIEGSELEALKGTQNILLTSKPNLAICVYHKPEDLITIPQFIQSLVPEYTFYLRHHQNVSWDTVLYAVIKE